MQNKYGDGRETMDCEAQEITHFLRQQQNHRRHRHHHRHCRPRLHPRPLSAAVDLFAFYLFIVSKVFGY